MSNGSGNISGLIVTILSVLSSLALSIGILVLFDYVPLLFSRLGYSGVIIITHSIPTTLIEIGASSIGLHFLITNFLEKLLSCTLVRASFYGIIPWLVFFPLLFYFPRGDYFAFLITLFFSAAVLTSLFLVFKTIRPGKSGAFNKLFGIILGISLLLIGVSFPIKELLYSQKLLSSFPQNADFAARLDWTNNFFLNNPSIQEAIYRKLKSEPTEFKNNAAFMKNRIHTIVIDWMDGPQASASFESQDGNIIEFCRGDKLECKLATGKEKLN